MSNRQRSFSESRRRGWGMGLYRNRSEGWIGGVCAGLLRIGMCPTGSSV